MFPRLFITFAHTGDPRVGGGDSFTDRLNNRYTPYILVCLAFLVMSRQYFGEPIGCWCPAEFPKSHVEFTNQVCWVQSTYFLPYDKEIPKRDSKRDYIGYYQWVGLLLTFQAILFYMPRMLWKILSQKSGISVSTITDAAVIATIKQDQVQVSRHVMYMVKHMSKFLTDTSRSLLMAGSCKSMYLLLYGNYLCGTYLFVKLVYILHAIFQMILLGRFLGTKYELYGFEILDSLRRGEGISQSHRFPRVSMCDVDIRHLGRVNTYTVQCALPINLFNEKIFIFVWFWIVFVMLATFVSLLLWTYIFIFLSHEARYIKTRLMALDKFDNESDAMITSFIDMFLRRDGLFLIKMVAKNGSDLVAAELIAGLWDHFLGNKRMLLRLEPRPQYADKIIAMAGATYDEEGEDNVTEPDDASYYSETASICSKIHFSKLPTFSSIQDITKDFTDDKDDQDKLVMDNVDKK